MIEMKDLTLVVLAKENEELLKKIDRLERELTKRRSLPKMGDKFYSTDGYITKITGLEIYYDCSEQYKHNKNLILYDSDQNKEELPF